MQRKKILNEWDGYVAEIVTEKEEVMMFLYYLAYWLTGYALMLLVWWWRGNDVTVADAATFAVGAAVSGPLLLVLYALSEWDKNRPRREPVILIRGKGK